MIVLYRVCAKPSTKDVPFYSTDKRKLVALCYQSFLSTCDMPFELKVIADNCDQYRDIFEVSHPMMTKFEWLHPSKSGNFWTYKEQIQIAQGLDDEVVLIVEDDYLWRPNTLHTLHDSVQQLGLVFPYDHPGHFLEDRFNRFKLMTMVGNNTYRKCQSNTLTFATTSEFVDTYYDVLTTFGTCDHEMFTRISETENLWCPVYSFATHCVSGLLAPNVDWRSIANLHSSHLQ